MALEPHEVTALTTVVVTVVVIAANVAITWINLRHTRKRARDERVWTRRADLYEQILAFIERARGARAVARATPKGEPIPVLRVELDMEIRSQLLLWASPEIQTSCLLVVQEALNADKALIRWRTAPAGSEDERAAGLEMEKRFATADEVAEGAMDAIHEELLHGRHLDKRQIAIVHRLLNRGPDNS